MFPCIVLDAVIESNVSNGVATGPEKPPHSLDRGTVVCDDREQEQIL